MNQTNNSATRQTPVVLGRLSGLYGVKGWFRVHSYTEPRDALLNYKDWLLGGDDHWQPVSLADGRPHGRGLVARVAGIDDRDAAAHLVGAEIAVPREVLPAAEPGRYYWSDLVGLRVRHRDGRELGTLAYLLATGAHDVIVVRAADGDGSKEILIPFVMDRFILDVDFAAGAIEVDWEWD